MEIEFNWCFGNANRDTLSIKPIRELADKWLAGKAIIVDPFARDCLIGTHRNDLNPDTKANYNMDALDFLKRMREEKIIADAIIFDPPFSPRQISECYKGIGLTPTMKDTQRTCSWRNEKDVINDITRAGSIFFHLGWTTHGMGETRGWKKRAIQLVYHGPGSNDTICMVEERTAQQFEFGLHH
jgi:hypothetical protein